MADNDKYLIIVAVVIIALVIFYFLQPKGPC